MYKLAAIDFASRLGVLAATFVKRAQPITSPMGMPPPPPLTHPSPIVPNSMAGPRPVMPPGGMARPGQMSPPAGMPKAPSPGLPPGQMTDQRQLMYLRNQLGQLSSAAGTTTDSMLQDPQQLQRLRSQLRMLPPQ